MAVNLVPVRVLEAISALEASTVRMVTPKVAPVVLSVELTMLRSVALKVAPSTESVELERSAPPNNCTVLPCAALMTEPCEAVILELEFKEPPACTSISP